MSHRILVTGGTGLAGRWLASGLGGLGAVLTTSLHGGDVSCDLRSRRQVDALLAASGPTLVVHTAALTDVDGCEATPELAAELNQGMVSTLVEALPEHTTLILLSTDQVYPQASGPHAEKGVGPVNCYGLTKLAGEQEALRHRRTLVLRTNFFGPSQTAGRESISDFVLTNLSQGKAITLFSDVLFSPLYLGTLVTIVEKVVRREVFGVLNAGSREGLSKAEFGLRVAKHKGLAVDKVTVGRSTSLSGRAPRPSDLRLDVRRLEGVLGQAMPTLAEEIAKL